VTTVAFREAGSPGPWHVEVLLDGALAGHIYRCGGVYCWFEGPHNDVTWSLSDVDRERLETQVRSALVSDGHFVP
jgi:hypothetical protein